MKKIFFIVTLSIAIFSCKAPAVKDAQEVEVEKASAKSIETTSVPEATSANNLSEFIDKYPVISTPITFKWNSPEQGKILMVKPFDTEDRTKICNAMVKCSDDEQLFYVGKYVLESGKIALISFIVGDFTERLILSVHDADDRMLSSEVLNMTSEELDYGYASYISKSFKIYRSKMFYKSGTTEMEVDSEEEFHISVDGKIEKQ